jgi:hypothetical protein
MSTALTLLSHVWTNNKTTAWEALNHCMRDAAKLAVGAKLEWAPGDFDHIGEKFRAYRWLGERGWEWLYAMAVWLDNSSFIQAYEEATKRRPFIANDVSAHGYSEGYAHANSQHRQRGRIALGSEVRLHGVRFECTSINNERVVLTSRTGEGKRTIKKLTPEDCKALWPAPKKLKAAKEVAS